MPVDASEKGAQLGPPSCRHIAVALASLELLDPLVHSLEFVLELIPVLLEMFAHLTLGDEPPRERVASASAVAISVAVVAHVTSPRLTAVVVPAVVSPVTSSGLAAHIIHLLSV